MNSRLFCLLCLTITCSYFNVRASGDEVTVKYFFGSRWPGCRQFGRGDFEKLYATFQDDSNVNFELHPAVRSPQDNCIEEQGCDWERVTLCAFNQTNTSGKVNFLACMDAAAETPLTQVALNAGKRCASTANVDAKEMTACYNGDQGENLLEAASKVWNKQFPKPSFVPHTFVNSKDVQADYSDLKKAICNDLPSSPACGSLKYNYI